MSTTRTAASMILLLLSAACHRDQDIGARDLDLAVVAREDGAGETSRMLGLQRELLAQLHRHDVHDSIADERFLVGTPDSLALGPEHRRIRQFLSFYSQRIPLDTAMLRLAGDLSRYDRFEVLTLNERQRMVISHRDDPAKSLMTAWHEDEGRWRALSVIINPASRTLEFYRARSREGSQSGPTYYR